MVERYFYPAKRNVVQKKTEKRREKFLIVAISENFQLLLCTRVVFCKRKKNSQLSNKQDSFEKSEQRAKRERNLEISGSET